HEAAIGFRHGSRRSLRRPESRSDRRAPRWYAGRAPHGVHHRRRADGKSAGGDLGAGAGGRQRGRHAGGPRRPPAGAREKSRMGGMRTDIRASNQLRDTTITPDYLEHAEGSVLIQAGRTRVICTASVEDRVPQFLRNTGKGWVTAE